MYNQISKQKLVIIGVGLIFLVGILRICLNFVNKRTVPKLTEISSPYGELKDLKDLIVFKGNSIEIPEKMPQYEIDLPNLMVEAGLLADKLKMTQKNGSTNLWQAAGGAESLNLINEIGVIQYSLYDPKTVDESGMDVETARTAANAFVEKMGWTVNMDMFVRDEPEFFGNDLELEPVDQDSAAFTAFYYTQSLDGYPLLYNDQDTRSLSVMVRNDYRVIKATYTPSPKIKQKLDDKRTLSFESILGRIKSGEGRIISLQSLVNRKEIKLSELKTAELTKAMLEYRVDTINKLAMPVIRFIGVAEAGAGIYDIEVVVGVLE